MACKLHINLSQGLIEVEGTEEFVMNIYEDFKEKISSGIQSPANTNTRNASNTKKNVKIQENGKKFETKVNKKSKQASGSGYSLNKNINLYDEGKTPSLKSFMGDFKANANFSRNLLFVHYLKELKGLDNIGPNELYTCYKHMSIKVPNIVQSLRDVSSRKGWLDNSNSNDLQITVLGENAIEHDLRNTSEE